MNHHPALLGSYLEPADTTHKIIAHAHLLRQLTQHYENLVPDYCTQASRVANLNNGVLVLHADNGAIAARLRQLAPRLTEGFSSKGYACNAVKVRVQMPLHSSAATAPVSAPRPLPPHGRQELQRLAQSLPDGQLKDAIIRLLTQSL